MWTQDELGRRFWSLCRWADEHAEQAPYFLSGVILNCVILAFRKEREIEGICKSMVGWTQGAHRLFARFTFQMATSHPPPPKSPSLICRAVKISHCSTGASSAQWESRTILGTASCAVSVPSPGFLQRFFTKRFTTALVVGPGLDTGCDDPARAVSLYQHTVSLQENHMP